MPEKDFSSGLCRSAMLAQIRLLLQTSDPAHCLKGTKSSVSKGCDLHHQSKVFSFSLRRSVFTAALQFSPEAALNWLQPLDVSS